jgi:hypothetical protein
MNKSKTCKDGHGHELAMSSTGLPVDVGDNLQLQFLGANDDARYYVKVIGYLQDKSLLITAPHVNGKMLTVREGQRLAGRLLAGSDVIGFTSNVLRICGRPYPYLHLSYPHDMQAITVRKAARVSLTMKGVVRRCEEGEAVDTASQALPVIVDDLSTTGARLVTNEFIAEKGELVNITIRVKVAGVEEDLNLVAIVRNVREEETEDGKLQLLHGVEFQFTDRSESILLHAFVYEYLASHGG